MAFWGAFSRPFTIQNPRHLIGQRGFPGELSCSGEEPPAATPTSRALAVVLRRALA